MAEFIEVARAKRRMCKAQNGCGVCKLQGICSLLNVCSYSDDDVKKLENEVMSWAAEHPEPVYPTFGEWLEKQGIVKLVNSDRYEEDGRKVYMLLESVENKIPAELAQKLGIEPKEGQKWQ